MQPESRYKKGDKIAGRYLVHQALMGGMGEVYLCLDLEHDLPFALKTFQARYLTNQKLRQAFESEVATWVALEKHPNIVRCYYTERIDNQLFMFLEWIASDESHGTDLRSWLARGPLDVRLALDFAIDICRGLMHASQKQPGLVHRDLKPDNVLVAQGRVAKITDFGLAKMVQDAAMTLPEPAVGPGRRQHLSNMGGTPPYMAPEQWRGEALDSRTDIYAVGCILFEMLTGRPLFTAGTPDGLRTQHLQAEVPELTSAEILPKFLNPVLARCLAKQRARRWTSADVLLQELWRIYQQKFGQAPRAMPLVQDFTAVDYNNRGNTYHALGRYDKALEDYSRALRLDPNDAMAFYNRGVTYKAVGRHAEALAEYGRALRIDPNYAPAHYNRGNIYAALGQNEEALAEYGLALRIDPNFAFAYANRGAIYRDLGRDDEALADYTQALRIHPNYALAYFNIGAVHGNRGAWREALPYFEKAAQLGESTGAEYAARAREELGIATQSDPAQQAFEAFQQANARDEMRQAVAQFPALVNPDFMASIEQVVAQQAPPNLKPAFEQRLAWLRQIANQQ